MTEYRLVEYTIKRDGVVEERVLQAQGKSCLILTQDIELALGQVTKRETIDTGTEPSPNTQVYVPQQQG